MGTKGVSSDWVKETGPFSPLSEWTVMCSEDMVLLLTSSFQLLLYILPKPHDALKPRSMNHHSKCPMQLIFLSKSAARKKTKTCCFISVKKHVKSSCLDIFLRCACFLSNYIPPLGEHRCRYRNAFHTTRILQTFFHLEQICKWYRQDFAEHISLSRQKVLLILRGGKRAAGNVDMLM